MKKLQHAVDDIYKADYNFVFCRVGRIGSVAGIQVQDELTNQVEHALVLSRGKVGIMRFALYPSCKNTQLKLFDKPCKRPDKPAYSIGNIRVNTH